MKCGQARYELHITVCSRQKRGRKANLPLVSQNKTERLVNLTMALLATKRYLRKSEIFQKVSGYEGSAETKERMFERDKDDLRNLGIEIEVSSQDPLFEDETGYRIRPESYQLPVTKFTMEENSLIAAALNLWSSAETAQEANNALRRLQSFPGGTNEIFPELVSPNEFLESGLAQITKALSARSAIEFEYRKKDSVEKELRRVHPFGLSTWQGGWYLVGEDLVRGDIRVFKLSRVTSQISVSSKRSVYEIPSDFAVKDYLIMLNKDSISASWKVLKGQANALRIKAQEITEIDQDWDLVTLPVVDADEVIRLSMWHFDSAVLMSPSTERNEVVKRLGEVLTNHG